MTGDRLRLIKLIHVARRELGMDDDSYRLMLSTIPQLKGKSSAKDCTVAQLETIVDQLKRRGFKVRAKTKQRRQADDRQSRLIRHLWLELHNDGVVRDSSEGALASYIKRLTGVEDLHWLSTHQASQIIESLKKWQQRTSKKPEIPDEQ